MEFFTSGIDVPQKLIVAIGGGFCTVSIAVFPDVMTGYVRPQAFETPTILWLVDPPESRFVLKHQADSSML